MHCLEKLACEEGIAFRFCMEHFGEFPEFGCGCFEGVGQQFAEVVFFQGGQPQCLDLRSVFAKFFQHFCQGVRDVRFVLPVGADYQQVVSCGGGDRVANEQQTGHVRPVQIVQKENQGAVGTGEHADEVLKDHVEAVLVLHRAKRRDVRGFSDNPFDFGNHVGDGLPA